MQRVRGTQDWFEQESSYFRNMERAFYDKAQRFGFGEIRTPIFEHSEVFHRTLGETSDVVSKETYTFKDRSDESLTLRPEGTAGIARAFISEGLAQKIPLKLYYCGPMFRYERPQKGRLRQFHQIGVEVLGIESYLMDIECLQLGYELLKSIGIENKCNLLINTLGDLESRATYRETLVTYYEKFKNDLSADSKVRLGKNPMRILDSKDEGDKKINEGAPKLEGSLNEASRKYFDSLINGLNILEIPYRKSSQLVRGLDYYTHTVFEFVTTELGAQGTVLAGGRYDGLIETMGGPKTPGVGWAAGVERLVELSDKSLLTEELKLIALVPADEVGEIESLRLASRLRSETKFKVEIIYGGNVGKKMKKASNKNALYTIIIGSQEVEKKEFGLKNMSTGEQRTLALEILIAELKDVDSHRRFLDT
ncbi:MAG: histidine--tRNA ligase [Bdellovibrio sp. 28-41-41]|nr:MAG: histidine--tRNA ligase [Bdellovibrio sp. 28-41-41]